MNNVSELIEAYSVHMQISLFLINEDGIVDIDLNMDPDKVSLLDSSHILDDVHTIGKLINKPTIFTPTNEDLASLTFILSPAFKHMKKEYYILGGPFSEFQQVIPNIDSKLIDLINGEQKKGILKKMQSLTTIISSLYEKETIEDSYSQFIDVFNFIRDFKYEIELHESYLNSLLNEIIKTSKVDFIGVASKNQEDVFVIHNIVGINSHNIKGKMFHIGEGILGQAVVLEKEMKWINVTDSPRFSFLHQLGLNPVHFFSVPVTDKEVVQELYFGGTHKNDEIKDELLDLILFIVLFIKERQKNIETLKYKIEKEERYDGFLDLLTVYLHSKNEKNVVYKILDFCKLLNSNQSSCFTFTNGEMISLTTPSEELLEQHLEFINQKDKTNCRQVIGTYVYSHYKIILNNDYSGFLSIELSSIKEKEVQNILLPLELLTEIFNLSKLEAIEKTQEETGTNILEEHRLKPNKFDLDPKRNIGLEEIQNMIDINSVISELPLTSREKEILHLILEGLNNQEVGSYLNISVHTVKNHITNIYKKLNVTDRVQAMTKIYRIKYGDE